MKTKTYVLLATLGLLAMISTSLALAWYFSAPQTTTSTEYRVEMDTLPQYMTKDAITQITGNVTLAGVAQSGIEVWIWENDVKTIYSDYTDSNGLWSISYYQNYTDGTPIELKAGVQK